MEKDNKYLLVAERLREVREQLKWSQQEVADKCGVSRVMWGKYESGASMPGSDVFIWLAMYGVDIYWVLTGQSQHKGLSADERALIDAYRKASVLDKETVCRVACMAGGINAPTPAEPTSDIDLVADYKPNRKAKK